MNPRPGAPAPASPADRPTRRTRLHYAWIVAGVTFIALMVSAGIRATPGVLIVPLEHEFGWTRATTSSAVSLGLLLYGLIGPFCAAIALRIGIRRTMSFALLLLSAAVLLATRVREPWQLILLWGLFVGAGTGMVATVMGAVVVNRWFSRRNGFVLGALTGSTATGQLLFLPILARLAENHGWRSALYLVGGAAALVVPLALLLVRERPADVGLLPLGADVATPPPPARSGSPAALAVRTLSRASRSRDFWLLAGTFFVCGASTNGLIGTHLIPACVDHGIPEVQAAGMLAMMGIFDLFGTTGSGWLSDRWDSRWLLFTYYGLRGLSLVFLPHALHDQGAGLSLFTVFYGLDWIATVPPTVKLATNAFGREDAPIVFGWVMAAHQVGAGVAALGAGVIRTQLGAYQLAFVTSGCMCLAAACMALAIGRRGPAAELVGAQGGPA
jgi:sugar phosphate permease